MGADMLSYNGQRLDKGIVSNSWLILPKWELAPWCSCWSPRPGRWSEPRIPGFAPARLIRNNWFSSEFFFYGMAIFSITTLPITIAKNNQFVQSPILTESPNSTTAPARRRWRNIPISWEWSLCLQTILGDNHCRDFGSSAKQEITRDSFHGLYRGADATMGRDVGSRRRWRWCSRRDLEVGSHSMFVRVSRGPTNSIAVLFCRL